MHGEHHDEAFVEHGLFLPVNFTNLHLAMGTLTLVH